MLHTKSQGNPAFWFWKRIFLKGFYHIWAWWPSWSCDHNHFEQTIPKDSPYEIRVQLAQWFQRRRCLKMLTDGRTDHGRQSHWYTNSSPRSLRLRWTKKCLSVIEENVLWPINLALHRFCKAFSLYFSSENCQITLKMCVCTYARGPTPRGYKTFHTELSWARNLSCS